MKKLLTMLIMLFALFSAAAAHGEIYSYDQTEPVTKGVTLRTIKRFYGDSWQSISCIIADLKEPSLQLDLLKGPGADSLMTVDNLAKTQQNVIAAVNADFFDATKPSTGQGFSLGIEVKNGELLQSQIDENMAAGFYNGYSLNLSYMTMSITVTAPNGETAVVQHLNKHTDYYGDLLMYTSVWNNSMSPAPGGEVVEMVVENGVVTEFRRGLPPTVIPANGYVLAVSEGVSMFLANNFQVGDRVALNISATPSLEGIKTAFGGGTMLLKNGQKAPITHSAPGRAPRTCIGTSADGTVVYIITVDGRQQTAQGMTMDELANLALELGCANALNLDGGGSTRLAAKTFWNSELHTVNSPTENRRVINAVSIVSDVGSGYPAGIRLKADSETVLLGDSVTIESRFYDENENAVWPEGAWPSYSASGALGSFNGSEFTPASPGTAQITAYYNGIMSEPVYVYVIGEPAGISLPQNIDLAVGQSQALIPEVHGVDGAYTFVKNSNLLSPSVSNPQVATYSDGVVHALSEGYCILTMSYNGISSSVLITVGNPQFPAPYLPENICIDSKRGTLVGGNSFGIFTYDVSPSTVFDTLLYRRGLRSIASSDSYGFLGSYNASLLPTGLRTPIAANSFSAIDKGFALIISLPKNGTLSGGNWIDMANALSSISSSNIIVLTNAAPTGGNDAETRVFYDYMDFISKSKNVFVVQSGRRNGVTVRGNVRYITVADASRYDGVIPAMEKATVLRFTMLNGECMYDFERIFNYNE